MGQYDTPAYTVEKAQDAFEIRAYPALLVAEVETTGKRDEAINSGFRALADFIFGNNSVKKNVDMTTPVIQQSTKIAMTAPVTQSSKDDSKSVWHTRFMMPHNYTLDTLPKPNNDKIRIFETAAVRYATIRFSGFTTQNRIKDHEEKLVAWIKKNNLKSQGAPVYAFYNPPFTIPFLRRNEIWIEITSK